MKLRRFAIILALTLIVLTIASYPFLSQTNTSTVSKPPVTVNAYWLKTNITLGESVTFVVKAVNSNFTAQILKENPSKTDELVSQYKGSGLLTEKYTPCESATYYIKVILSDGTSWLQQKEYRLTVK